ncbi:MAG: 3'-5' exoribonuclease YhaM family protein [Planctomycetota bacterium]|jgi:3'-5' exoribonuclease
MKKKTTVDSLDEGMGVDDLFQIEICNLRRARNGSYYLHIVLGDRTGRVEARKWDIQPAEAEGISPGDIVHVRGFVERYKGSPQVIVRDMRAMAGEEIDKRDFLPASRRDPHEMMDALKSLLAGVSHPHLRVLLDAFFDDEAFCRRFMETPAATRLHHAYLGGLLEHTLTLVRCVQALVPVYPSLNADLLMTGAFLHDIGKIDELSPEPFLNYTDRGRLLGHIELGARLLAGKAARIPDFPPPLLDQLTHLILSHHGRMEFGSPKLPMTPEAVVLNFLDDIDAKVAAVEALKAGEGRGNWTEFIRGFDRAFFLGGEEERKDTPKA